MSLINSPLIGTWKLIQCQGVSKEGEVCFPYGDNPYGQLIYTAKGTMSVLFSDTSRQNFVSEDLEATTDNEKLKAYETFDAYCGKYTVVESDEIVIHHIKAGRVPNWTGLDRSRSFKIIGDQLTLKTEYFPMRGSEWIVEVVWQRVL